jgi:hypothetical protein
MTQRAAGDLDDRARNRIAWERGFGSVALGAWLRHDKHLEIKMLQTYNAL